MQQIPCGTKGLATRYLDEIHNSPDAEYAVILPTVKCVAHADAVEGSEQEAPAGVLDSSTLVAWIRREEYCFRKQWAHAHQAMGGRVAISKIGVTSRQKAWNARKMQW